MKGAEQQRHDRESALYQQQLQQYISTYLAQGYTPTELESYLESQGYDKQSVRQALKTVNRTYHQGNLEIHKEPHHMNLLVVVLVGLLILGGGLYFYVSNSTPYEFFISLEDASLESNQPVEFNIATTKEVVLETVVTSNSEGTLLLQREDTLSSPQSFFVKLEDAPPGSYTVDVFVTYKQNTKQHSFTVQVQEETTNTLTPSLQVSQETIDTLALALSLQDESLCRQITQQSYKDECYFSIARDTLQERLCTFVQDSARKDNCYLTQVLGGNNIGCQDIQDVQIKSSCMRLSS